MKAKENDPHRKLEEAMEAAKRKAEQTKRLGPPVEIKDPREILARVTGRNNPASSVKPKDRPKDTTALSRKPADSPDNRHRDTVEVKTDRSQAKAHHTA